MPRGDVQRGHLGQVHLVSGWLITYPVLAGAGLGTTGSRQACALWALHPWWRGETNRKAGVSTGGLRTLWEEVTREGRGEGTGRGISDVHERTEEVSGQAERGACANVLGCLGS